MSFKSKVIGVLLGLSLAFGGVFSVGYLGNAIIRAERQMTETHALLRTSQKGQMFIGTCMKCGKTGLSMKQATEECENPSRMRNDEALLNAIDATPIPTGERR